jgi:DNA-directed RNA polymerase sigma subunit (sigma70/sigma32)
MEQTLEPRRRLNVLTKAERRQRIFARLREGWAYDEIAREERVSAERIRQIVSEVLGKRVIDRRGPRASAA